MGSPTRPAPAEQLDAAATPLVPDASVPSWLKPLIRRSLGGPLPGLLHRTIRTQQSGSRESAVLMLLSDGIADGGPDVLLTQRASTMRTHAGQPAFPGGAVDVGEDAVAAALREGHEETGVDPRSVTPLVLLPKLYVPVSEFVVQPVIAYWHEPGPVTPVNPAETASVARVPIAALVDPANRVWVRYREFRGVGFEVADMLVWGFTGGLVDAMLQLGGWAQRWEFEHTRTVELTPR